MDDGYHDDTADASSTTQRNSHLRYPLDDPDGLWLSFSDPQKQECTLGKGDADIHLPDPKSSSKGSPHIQPIHASFQVVEDTGAVLLWDHSDNGTVEPLPHSNSYTVKFRSNAKSVLVAQGINSKIAFGKDQWYQFEIQWQSDGLYGFPKDEPYRMGPSNARVKKYVMGREVGAGSYGSVSWVLDATSGKIIAVKKFHKLSGKNLEFATREMTNLFKINRDDSIKHEHILQILDCAGGGKTDDWGEIFMPLMQGNLKTLVERYTPPGEHAALSDIVLRQMLLALQCIASHKLIHRDVKPENILYDYDATGNYRFCLGDFGLSNDPELARTAAGTEPFMAPEVFGRKRQTTKVDIWSLFATVVWTRTPQFRRDCSQMHAQDLHGWLVAISRADEYATMQRMASIDPKRRPSATEQLAILDGQLDDHASVRSFGSTSGDEMGADLSARFSNVLNLRDNAPGLTYGSGSSEPVTSPEVPYYEPYVSGLFEAHFPGQAGPSKGYMPPSPGPEEAPRDYGAWVRPYENAYGPPVSHNSGSGTAVPDTWTAVAPTTIETEEEPPRRKSKGKHRS